MRLQVKPSQAVTKRNADEKNNDNDKNNNTDVDFPLARALVTTWKPHFFDGLVHQVAAELESMIAIASPQSHNIYCPCDGGMDIFVANVSVAELEARFPDWRSQQPDKL